MRGCQSRFYDAVCPRMRVSAVQKFTTLDFPNRLSCIVFTPGCNFRCGYCHNPEFVLPERILKLQGSFIEESTVFSFLEKRKGKLDGVVVSGGEPTLQYDLADFLRKVKAMGFQTKLDTNGSLPELLEPLFKEDLIDYIAMDIKTSLKRYEELVGACIQADAIKKSIELIKKRAPDYEFRTTILEEHHDEQTLQDVAQLIGKAKRFALQGFRPGKTLNPEFESYQLVHREALEKRKESFRDSIEEILIRV